MNPKTVKLPSGKQAVVRAYKGRDIREAIKLADGDNSKMIFAIIASTSTVDGETVLMEDLDEMEGRDVIALMGEFGNFTPSGQAT